jgi:hypothetical protein
MGNVAVVARDANRLDVFGLDGTGGVSRRWWDSVSWHPPGNGWEPLGSAPSTSDSWVRQVAVASWDPGRLDVIGLAKPAGSFVLLHKAWTGSSWSPSQFGWNNLGGDLSDYEPMVVAWGPNRLDIFAVWSDLSMYHKAWTGSSWSGWSPLGGAFRSGPAVASWGPNRLDVFGLGNSLGMYHKAWMGTLWHPSNPSWQGLGGVFAEVDETVFPPAVASWGPDRLDIFGPGKSLGMYHKAWTGSSWYPSTTGWQALGGTFRNVQPAVASWGPNRLDIFAIGDDHGMYHKAWMGDHWHPSNPSWQGLGGWFTGAPAAVAWGPDRLDVFAVGSEEMYHKAWNGSHWEPSLTGWHSLGGQFSGF